MKRKIKNYLRKILLFLLKKLNMPFTDKHLTNINSIINRIFKSNAFPRISVMYNNSYSDSNLDFAKLVYVVNLNKIDNICISIEYTQIDNQLQLNFLSTNIKDYKELSTILNSSFAIYDSFKDDILKELIFLCQNTY